MRSRLPIVLLLVCATAFLVGLVQLFRLRFETGDIYPEYSSLRSDPLGTMALYESLEKMPRLSVGRDYNAGNRLPEAEHTTYLHLAASRFDWLSLPEDLNREIERFLARGGRLVITLLPEDSQSSPFTPVIAPPPAQKTKKSKTGPDRAARRASLRERWGIEFRVLPLEPAANATHKPARVLNQTDLLLPPALDWHSAVVFTNLGPAWQPIYTRGLNPVLVERRFGPGSVVFATDSFFVSNEALTRQRHADLLAWLVGGCRHVVFDEAHFGIVENVGTATLMRKYRLHGLAASLMLLAGLFIWKNSLSFVPPYPDESRPAQVAGKDAAEGFVNLLRRNIASRDVLRVCFDEWTKSLLGEGRHSIARVDQAQAVLETESARARTEQDPVAAYREICAALKGKT